MTGYTGSATVHAVRVSDHDIFGKRGECGAWLSSVSDASFNPDSAYACKLCRRATANTKPVKDRQPYPEPRCTCHARKSGKHAQACELWNTTGNL